jgi:multidrug efflux pump
MAESLVLPLSIILIVSGMLGVTFFGLFLTSVFYVLLRTVEKRLSGGAGVSLPVAAE